MNRLIKPALGARRLLGAALPRDRGRRAGRKGFPGFLGDRLGLRFGQAGALLLLRSSAGGSVAALWSVFNVVAYASLIYTGPLAPALPFGISAMLVTYAVVAGAVALGTGLPGVGASALPATALVYVALASTFSEHLVAQGMTDPGMRTQAVLLACGLVTVASGLALLLAGALRVDALVRLLPYPVVAGYYAGIGWLFILGGLRFGANVLPSQAGLVRLAGPAGWQAAACIGLAAALLWVPRRVKHWAVMPVLLLGTGLAFHAVRIALRISEAAAQDARWLLGPFPPGRAALPSFAGGVGLLDGPALRLMLPYAASAAVLASLAMMLNVSAIELEARRSLRLNREMMIAGGANLLGGLLGGIACGQGFATTMVLRKQGAMTRLAALVPAAGALALAFAGPAVLDLVPRFVVASLLLSTGFDWLVLRPAKDLPTLPRHEAASVVAVAVAVVWAGTGVGVLIGLGLALVLFALGYARTPVIRAALPRSACRSTVARPAEAESALVQAGEAILLCRLQGHVFFLNASEIPVALARRHPRGVLRHLILDFRDVTGVDSSVHTAFERLRQIGAEQGFRLLLCGMRPAVERQFRGRGLLQRGAAAPGVVSFDTADTALQDAEAHVLREAGFDGTGTSWSLGDQLSRLSGGAVPDARLAPYLRTLRLNAGDVLIRQGDGANAMYFLTAGTVATQIARAGGAPPLRLYTAGRGTVIGEVGMLCTGVRTASVVAETECEALALTAEALGRMERDDAPLATLLHRFLLREVASKLADSTRLIEMQAQ